MQDWLQQAASMPIAFSQVREDPRLDVEICRPGDSVVMIASGGDTAVCLSRRPLHRLVVVDMNPAQLALTRCKWHLSREAEREQTLRFLGHASGPRYVRRTLAELGLPENALGPIEFVEERGADQVGRYELLFAQLRRELKSTTQEQAFQKTMALENLVALFGQQATQNPRRSFADHFSWRTSRAQARPDAAVNPFLGQLLRGKFADEQPYDWLKDWNPPLLSLEYVQAPMLQALREMAPASANVVHLSNILDWLTVKEASELLQAATRVLKSGGRTIIRQLNSTLDIPSLETGLSWSEIDPERDRSFFYPHIHLGHKP